MRKASFIFSFIFIALPAYAIEIESNHHYVVNDESGIIENKLKLLLKASDFDAIKTSDKIFEIYFDTPELHYLNNNGEIRYKAIEYISKKKKKVKYYEVILSAHSDREPSVFPVKHYNKVKNFEEKHPLLGLVKRKDREHFIAQMSNDGIDYPLRLKEILRVSKLSDSYGIKYKEQQVGILKINTMTASAFDDDVDFIMATSFSNKKNIQAFTASDQEHIGAFFNKLANMLTPVPSGDVVLDNEYAVVFHQLKKDIILFDLFLKYPFLVHLSYAAYFAVVGLVLLKLFFWRRI